ncbi:hypothetical protein A1F94_010374 [Pyrenophora tritici-repentis]|uniref:Uncharacterized protein n=2 Tax=Pyrenophora tritici-repentis TaxID=45151 RepID=A0A2W1DA17_9PLEO|nr:uncharacterized protein PTRG_06980 [Pyrenophora tritici-repentis Pt-1C-BFP]KAA8614528.1 hypothetical protein PtrV1_11558 [Pyrenophora tritici-repentis]EDU49899.1 predicted protein [Pyrenophora tritici-repentis Pt-1C-BFP]KAF7444361.1 hypothetical protein A1F99_109140 [Pyrenophora tritici-repentis]KAF7564987.1 hypothetical protein PtrM4_044210 [Pyrenophora tritici-repentis]KAG9378605.1 hypothetical protein A1F94_010374 [Pyrenophora tritici-repentis]
MQSRPTNPPSSRSRFLLMDELAPLQASDSAHFRSEGRSHISDTDSAYGSRETSPIISRALELPIDNNSPKIEESSLAPSHARQHTWNSCFKPKVRINSTHDEPYKEDLRDSEPLESDIRKLPFYGVIGHGRSCASMPAMATSACVHERVSSDAKPLPTNTTLSSTGNGPIYRWQPQRKRESPLFWFQDVTHIWQLPGRGWRSSREAELDNSNKIGSTSLEDEDK